MRAYCSVCSALVGRYDGKRVSLSLLRRLDECKLCSLAYLITTAHTDRRVDGLLHSQLAMNSHELQRSAEHLWAEFITTAQYPKLEESSPLYKVSDCARAASMSTCCCVVLYFLTSVSFVFLLGLMHR